MIYFSVPIEPVAFARAGQHGKTHFTPAKQARHMATIRQYAERAMHGRPPFEGAIRLTARFSYTQPASWPKKKKAATFWKTSKPDADNLTKLIKDSLSGCAYLDDAQVASMTVEKFYADAPCVEIMLSSLDAGPKLGLCSETDLFT
jgi:Holliday junction resolvase RusA-like endonuclease